jgi:hypothetical protein
MPNKLLPWLQSFLRMGERRKLGDVALDLLLFAGMVCQVYPNPFPILQYFRSSAHVLTADISNR